MGGTNRETSLTSFRSIYNGVEETQVLLSSVYGAAVKIEGPSGGDFRFEMSYIGNDVFALCDSLTTGGETIWLNTDNDDIVIKRRVRGSFDLITRSGEFQLTNGLGFIYTPNQIVSCKAGKSTALSSLRIKRAAFEAGLSEYAEQTVPHWSGILGFSLNDGFGHLIQALSNKFRENFETRADYVYSETSLKLIQDAAIFAIAEFITGGTDHDPSEKLSVSRRNVMRAVDLINSQTAPLTIHDLAASLGISVRALQVGFRKHLDTSPYNALKSGRIEGARRDLMAGRVTNVREAAIKWGFSNLARFNQEYLAVTGELPKDSLAHQQADDQ